MNKKAYLEISFTWLFAIIVGAVILFLAIFAVSKFIKTAPAEQDIQTSKELGILLNPLEMGFETAKTTTIIFPTETRFYNKCTNYGEFGEQKIQTQQKSFSKWSTTGLESSFQNKYLFSERILEGKSIYLFSKQFEFPFKTADLIYITSASTNYCFKNPPENIQDELSELKMKNVFLEECPENGINVCFRNDNCDINVGYGEKSVEKNGEVIYFEGDALMYAAIFSDADVYECQIKRLMQRTAKLCELYTDKENFLSQKCSSNIGADLTSLKNIVGNLESSEEIYLAGNLAEDIKEKNEDNGECRLW